jgi:hypothetical protein
MAQRTRAINQFADAVCAAVGLHRLYDRFAAAALLDDDGTILDMRPFAGDHACVACAIEWAMAVATDWHTAQQIVLLSSSAPHSLCDAREDDIRLYQGLRDDVAAEGMELVDWIQTDGADVRSLTYTCDVTPSWDAAS